MPLIGVVKVGTMVEVSLEMDGATVGPSSIAVLWIGPADADLPDPVVKTIEPGGPKFEWRSNVPEAQLLQIDVNPPDGHAAGTLIVKRANKPDKTKAISDDTFWVFSVES